MGKNRQKEWNSMDFWQCEFSHAGQIWPGWACGKDVRQGGIGHSKRFGVALGECHFLAEILNAEVFPLFGMEAEDMMVKPGTMLSVPAMQVTMLQPVPPEATPQKGTSKEVKFFAQCLKCGETRVTLISPGETFSFSAAAQKCGMQYRAGQFICLSCAVKEEGSAKPMQEVIEYIRSNPAGVRMEMQVSQRELSRMIGISKTSISSWECGTAKMSKEAALKILGILLERYPEVVKRLGF